MFLSAQLEINIFAEEKVFAFVCCFTVHQYCLEVPYVLYAIMLDDEQNAKVIE